MDVPLLKHSRQDSWSTHFTWNSCTPVYCSLRTIVFWLVTYSSVFVETSGAHTLLGTVIQLLNPASVHLFTDKSAGDLHWTNPRVVWEHPYSDQWERAIITRLIRVDQSQGSKSARRERGREREREGENLDIMKAPLLRRAALKITLDIRQFNFLHPCIWCIRHSYLTQVDLAYLGV
jgi:hypothetical protein